MRPHFIGWLGFTFTVIGAPIVLLPLATQCGVFLLWGYRSVCIG